ncbi:MAG: ferric reductase-like transmembrane domain-containing protein [Pseudomonadota bacterium]
MSEGRARLIWVALAIAIVVPIGFAAASPLLAWRQPVYIVAGFAGIIGLALMLVQPVLMGGFLPGLSAYQARRVHRFVGVGLVLSVVIHVAGLWVTSPPDVIDALLFVSPTPFSAWGVIAMWAVFGVGILVVFRQRLRLRPRIWRIAHTSLAVVIVSGTVIHALLIEGTMETVSKAALCALVVLITVKVFVERRVWARRGASQ